MNRDHVRLTVRHPLICQVRLWDVSTGNKVNVSPETTEPCNRIARQWATNKTELLKAEC